MERSRLAGSHPQIDALIDEGIVRDFGVSNFTISDMQQAQKVAKHPIIANQMEYNVLYKNKVDDTFKRYCSDNNIQIVAYQPVKRREVLTDRTILEIADAQHATAAQIALAWLIAQDALPIPKAINKHHIDENVAAVNIKLTEEEIAKLNSLT
jgi:diketogulonate reductase-like aldo/keto reductase